VDAGVWDAYRHNPPPLCDYAHGATTPALAFSPDGRTFACTKADRGLVICELATGREIRQLFPPPGVARDVAFTPDGRRLLSGEADGRIRLWDVAAGEMLREFHGHSGEVRAIAIARDGRTAVSAGWDGTVRLWELDSGRATAVLKGHDGVVWGVALSPDGRLALSGGQDRTVRLWDLASRRALTVWDGLGVYYGVLFSPDGRYAMAGGGDHKLTVWDVQTRQLVRTLEGHASPVGSVAITAAGDRVVTGCADNTVKVWEFPSGRLLRTIGGQRFVTRVALSADDRLILSGGLDGSVTLHALDISADAPALAGHTTWVWAVALSPDLRVAASGDAAGTVILWDLATGRELRRLTAAGGEVHCVQFSADGTSLLMAGGGLTIVDVSDGRLRQRFEGDPGGLYRASYSPDGLRVIGAGSDGVHIWDANTGRLLVKIQGPPTPAYAASFLPDGTRAFAGYQDGTLIVADTATGKPLSEVHQKQQFMVGAWIAPDGHTALANCDRAPGIDVWDLPTAVRSRVLVGHTSYVYTTVFGADSRHAVSGSMDYTLRLWDLATGAELYCFDGHRQAVMMVAASPDLRLIVSVGHDLVARVWDLRRPGRSDALRGAADRARAALAERPSDAPSLAALGEWYAFRGMTAWAVSYLEEARSLGASVPTLTLARCYWKLDRLDDASREFGRALNQATDPKERAYLQLCERAVQRGL
ncbi:MAG TPA: WD40 repeat domain-containing protein, partial [Jatrophihabitantaceae bacterium]